MYIYVYHSVRVGLVGGGGVGGGWLALTNEMKLNKCEFLLVIENEHPLICKWAMLTNN